jgi:hypothetical protein
MNDFAGLTLALLAGRGIGELPPVVQPELLRTGRLVEVMPDWRFPPFDLSLVHLGNRHLSKPCRLFKVRPKGNGFLGPPVLVPRYTDRSHPLARAGWQVLGSSRQHSDGESKVIDILR